MFTGIVETIGTLVSIEPRGGDRTLTIEAGAGFLRGVRVGDSIACSGACLTATRVRGKRFTADVSIQTLTATTARSWHAGTPLNLEKALTPTTPLGGHLVTGHIDGVGRLSARKPEARSVRLDFSVPKPLARYIASKGSICVDGVSLTVNTVGTAGVGAAGFGVNIIPHTLQHTTLGRLVPGDPVNLEVDLLARYLERLVNKK
ncbi:MAG TPA: riboflavin synthase [Verrucomicrobiae bacterium]|nr:riboflavin synthase [Verrucomicrobiae bacterium]